MSAAARALDAPLERARNEHAPPARLNRLGAPLWPADEPVASRKRVDDDPLPMEVWVLAVVYGASCN
jgi:hypothetical protein